MVRMPPPRLALLLYFFVFMSSASAHPQADALHQCWNEHVQSKWEPSTFADYLADKPTQLQMHTVWWSNKPGAALGIAPALTVFTVASPARLEALETQCASFPGPLAAGVYVALDHAKGQTQLGEEANNTLHRHAATMRSLFERMEARADACALRLLLLYELVGEPVMHKLFPKTAVLNAVLLAADTPLVAMLDVDLLPSRALSTDVLNNPTQAVKLIRVMQTSKTLVVLPAFEPTKEKYDDYTRKLHENVALALDVIKSPKPRLLDELQRRSFTLFDGIWHPEGHRATNLMRWLTADVLYEASFEFQFEPWYMATRQNYVHYDLRYRGYGREKIAQLMHVNASGYKLMVHPTAFVVHRPHTFSPSFNMFSEGLNDAHVQAVVTEANRERADAMLQLMIATGNPRTYGKVQFVKDTFTLNRGIEEMRAGTYRPLLDAPSTACPGLLPWWKDYVPLRRL